MAFLRYGEKIAAGAWGTSGAIFQVSRAILESVEEYSGGMSGIWPLMAADSWGLTVVSGSVLRFVDLVFVESRDGDTRGRSGDVLLEVLGLW